MWVRAGICSWKRLPLSRHAPLTVDDSEARHRQQLPLFYWSLFQTGPLGVLLLYCHAGPGTERFTRVQCVCVAQHPVMSHARTFTATRSVHPVPTPHPPGVELPCVGGAVWWDRGGGSCDVSLPFVRAVIVQGRPPATPITRGMVHSFDAHVQPPVTPPLEDCSAVVHGREQTLFRGTSLKNDARHDKRPTALAQSPTVFAEAPDGRPWKTGPAFQSCVHTDGVSFSHMYCPALSVLPCVLPCLYCPVYTLTVILFYPAKSEPTGPVGTNIELNRPGTMPWAVSGQNAILFLLCFCRSFGLHNCSRRLLHRHSKHA